MACRHLSREASVAFCQTVNESIRDGSPTFIDFFVVRFPSSLLCKMEESDDDSRRLARDRGSLAKARQPKRKATKSNIDIDSSGALEPQSDDEHYREGQDEEEDGDGDDDDDGTYSEDEPSEDDEPVTRASSARKRRRRSNRKVRGSTTESDSEFELVSSSSSESSNRSSINQAGA